MQNSHATCDFYLTVESNSRLLWFVITIRLVIGLKNSPHIINQSEVKPKPIVTSSHKFLRASCWLHAFPSSFCRIGLMDCVVFSVIGQRNYFGFAFTTLKNQHAKFHWIRCGISGRIATLWMCHCKVLFIFISFIYEMKTVLFSLSKHRRRLRVTISAQRAYISSGQSTGCSIRFPSMRYWYISVGGKQG